MVLLAVLRLSDGAYGSAVRSEIEAQAGVPASRGAVYITLDRLERKGLLRSWMADGSAERGGRPRRYYEPQPAALVALRDSRRALLRMWEGIEPEPGEA